MYSILKTSPSDIEDSYSVDKPKKHMNLPTFWEVFEQYACLMIKSITFRKNLVCFRMKNYSYSIYFSSLFFSGKIFFFLVASHSKEVCCIDKPPLYRSL